MKITRCRMNHLENPMGYQMERAVFSWQVEGAAGKRQEAARICLSLQEDMSEPLFDSGMTPEADSIGYEVIFDWKPGTRYYWTVMVRSDAGETAVSDVNWFETGKRQESWIGRWISCEKKERHPYFEKEIIVQKELRAARLYICGLGLYEAEIDGKRISEEYLTPYCNNYKEWLQYQTYDVTEELLHGGKLRILLGNGWYLGRFGYFSKPGGPSCYGDRMKLIAEVHLCYADGSEEVVGTDESWNVSRSKIVSSSIYDGETRDDTLSDMPKEPVCIVEEETPLVERYSTPVTVQEEICPVELLHTPAGELVLDLGQNLVGSFRLRVHEPAGQAIHIQFGEVLQKGCFYRENLRTALAEYRYISDGSEQFLQPHFTFYGYRYVKIEGVRCLTKEDFTALVLHSDLEKTGTLTTGHEKVNRLIQNVEWGQKGNFVDVPTDCPQRDERMGWTGDAQVFSATSCYLRDSYAFYRKYLHDMETEQKMLHGMVPDVVPSLGPVYRSCASVWGDAACIIPWNVYLFYGDKSILKDCFESMKAWVDYIREIDQNSHKWREQFHYGDWLALDHPGGKPDQCLGGTDEGYIAEIYYANSARIVAKAAKILKKEKEAKEYDALAERILKEIREEYFSPNGRCCIDTQTGLLLALHFRIPADKTNCRNRLKEKFKETEGMLRTGFVGTPLLCGQLTEEGMEHLAYDLLLNEEYPGWLYEINLGATTIWERWNSLNPDGTVSSTGMNSFNHYAYGSIAEWLYRYAAGLKPQEEQPGFRSVTIAPIPDIRIGHIDLCYRSAAGCYRIFWQAEDDDTFYLKVEIPFGCDARLKLPYAPAELFEDADNPIFAETEEGICYLTAGCYEVRYRTTQAMRRVYKLEDKLEDLLENKAAARLLESYIPGINGTPDSMRGQTFLQLLEDSRVERPDERKLAELKEKLERIW